MALMGKQRIWRKLHLAVYISTHEIIAAELSASNVTDGNVLPNWFKQTSRRINEILSNEAYDTRQCYESVRIKRGVPLIPPKKTSPFRNEVIRVT
ncbi:Mobile element protein [Candidatus Enterovibrio altilux]|uniref:Mobile element protein n=1 Tax=Candidatus Enterovibrio altilux TaxID=1927128 RepID=A0A291BB60_9GAMM|nr:Mobile element protein [Candidatus Enterovibrio luxaltus]